MKLVVSFLTLLIAGSAFAGGKDHEYRNQYKKKNKTPICVPRLEDGDDDEDEDVGQSTKATVYRTRWVKENRIAKILARRAGSCRLDVATAGNRKTLCTCTTAQPVFTLSGANGIASWWGQTAIVTLPTTEVASFTEAYNNGYTKYVVSAVANASSNETSKCNKTWEDNPGGPLDLPVMMTGNYLGQLTASVGIEPSTVELRMNMLDPNALIITSNGVAVSDPFELNVVCTTDYRGGPMDIQIQLFKP